MKKEEKKLINRLSRIQGQIGAIKKQIQEGDQDCVETMRQLKTSIQAMKKFGQAYMENYTETCIEDGKNQKEMEKHIKQVIKSAFSL